MGMPQQPARHTRLFSGEALLRCRQLQLQGPEYGKAKHGLLQLEADSGIVTYYEPGRRLIPELSYRPKVWFKERHGALNVLRRTSPQLRTPRRSLFPSSSLFALPSGRGKSIPLHNAAGHDSLQRAWSLHPQRLPRRQHKAISWIRPRCLTSLPLYHKYPVVLLLIHPNPHPYMKRCVWPLRNLRR